MHLLEIGIFGGNFGIPTTSNGPQKITQIQHKILQKKVPTNKSNFSVNKIKESS
jgi:hypothetical protein